MGVNDFSELQIKYNKLFKELEKTATQRSAELVDETQAFKEIVKYFLRVADGDEVEYQEYLKIRGLARELVFITK